MSRPTALVLRALGVGDFVTGLPALAVLRAVRPGHRIVLAAPRHFAPLAALARTVDEVVPGHELSPLLDPPQRPELAIDLHGNGPASRELLLACRPRRLLAFEYEDGPRWRPDEHEVARWCRLLVEGLPEPGACCPGVAGIIAEPDGVAMPDGGQLPRDATIVHCGAKSAARRWPPQRFAALARLLRSRGHDVLVTGGPGEQALAGRIAAASGTRAMDGLNLLQLFALVVRARLVVCGDTGIAHIAAAYAVPSVVLFGPVSPRVWGPPRHQRHQVLWHGRGDGDPHGARPDPALLRITVLEVAAAVERAQAVEQLPVRTIGA